MAKCTPRLSPPSERKRQSQRDAPRRMMRAFTYASTSDSNHTTRSGPSLTRRGNWPAASRCAMCCIGSVLPRGRTELSRLSGKRGSPRTARAASESNDPGRARPRSAPTLGITTHRDSAFDRGKLRSHVKAVRGKRADPCAGLRIFSYQHVQT